MTATAEALKASINQMAEEIHAGTHPVMALAGLSGDLYSHGRYGDDPELSMLANRLRAAVNAAIDRGCVTHAQVEGET